MEKKFSKSKIIILSIAILVAILSLSIAIFGMIKKNNDKQTNNNVKAWGSDDGIKLRTISQTINGVTYSVEYTSDSVIFKYDFKECLVGYIYGSTFEYTNGSYTGTYIKKDEFTIKNFTVYNDDGYKLYNYLRSSGLYIQYYYIDYDSIGSDDISSKNFTYTCSNIRFYLTEGPIFITVDGVQYSKGINRTSGDMGYFDVSNKEILWCTSSGQIDIKSEEALKLLAYEIVDTACINNDSLRSADVYLKRNLDMSLVKNMIPIGTDGNPFKGTFDGNGYRITNLQYTKSMQEIVDASNSSLSDYLTNGGLFGTIENATIKNLEIKDANFKTKSPNETGNKQDTANAGFYTGILVGTVKGTTKIENCLLKDCSLDITRWLWIRFGLADSRSAHTMDAHDSFTLTSNEHGMFDETLPASGLGGLVGFVDSGANLHIKNCAVIVDIRSQGPRNLGGFVGRNLGTINVSNSYYKGSISGYGYLGISFGGVSGGEGKVNATNVYISILKPDDFAFEIIAGNTAQTQGGMNGNKFTGGAYSLSAVSANSNVTDCKIYIQTGLSFHAYKYTESWAGTWSSEYLDITGKFVYNATEITDPII